MADSKTNTGSVIEAVSKEKTLVIDMIMIIHKLGLIDTELAIRAAYEADDRINDFYKHLFIIGG